MDEDLFAVFEEDSDTTTNKPTKNKNQNEDIKLE